MWYNKEKWRNEFKYGTKYAELSKDDIWKSAQRVYEGFPELMEASRKTL